MICNKCKQVLHESKFGIRENGKRRNTCYHCIYTHGGKEHSKKSREKNPELYKSIRSRYEVNAIIKQAVWLHLKPNKSNKDIFDLLQLRLKILNKTIKEHENIQQCN